MQDIAKKSKTPLSCVAYCQPTRPSGRKCHSIAGTPTFSGAPLRTGPDWLAQPAPAPPRGWGSCSRRLPPFPALSAGTDNADFPPDPRVAHGPGPAAVSEGWCRVGVPSLHRVAVTEVTARLASRTPRPLTIRLHASYPFFHLFHSLFFSIFYSLYSAHFPQEKPRRNKQKKEKNKGTKVTC